MEDEQKAEEEHNDIFQSLLDIDEGNKNCVDCGAENPTYVSINNGVTICEKCASEHSSLGYSISYVRKMQDSWDDHLMSYMLMGSNSKFLKSMDIFGVDKTQPINIKYRTNGVDYYRRNLKCKVNNEELKEMDYENANDICNESKEKFPEFENYNTQTVDLQEQPGNFPKKKGKYGVLGRVGTTIVKGGKTGFVAIKHGGQATISGLKKAGTFVAHKAEPVTNKIKQAGNFVAHKAQPVTNKIKQAGTFVAHKAEPVTNKIKQGGNYIGRNAAHAFGVIKGKIIKKKKDDNDIVVNIGEKQEGGKISNEDNEEGEEHKENHPNDQLDINEPKDQYNSADKEMMNFYAPQKESTKPEIQDQNANLVDQNIMATPAMTNDLLDFGQQNIVPNSNQPAGGNDLLTFDGQGPTSTGNTNNDLLNFY